MKNWIRIFANTTNLEKDITASNDFSMCSQFHFFKSFILNLNFQCTLTDKRYRNIILNYIWLNREKPQWLLVWVLKCDDMLFASPIICVCVCYEHVTCGRGLNVLSCALLTRDSVFQRPVAERWNFKRAIIIIFGIFFCACAHVVYKTCARPMCVVNGVFFIVFDFSVCHDAIRPHGLQWS